MSEDLTVQKGQGVNNPSEVPDINIKRSTEKLMTFSVPREVVKFMDHKLLLVLLTEYFIKNRNITTISKAFGIPVIDLKFFFNSAEAKVLFEEFKANASDDMLKDRSIEQLRGLLIDKLEQITQLASNRDSIEAVERMTPQIIELQKILNERDKLTNTRGKSIYEFPQEIQDIEEGTGFKIELDTKEANIKSVESSEYIDGDILEHE